MVRRLVGAERLAPDFDETYAAGGYYAVRHPTVANGLIVVVNDVLWSTRYRDACGTDGLAAAQAMLGWFRDRLARHIASGGARLPGGHTLRRAAPPIPDLKTPFD